MCCGDCKYTQCCITSNYCCIVLVLYYINSANVTFSLLRRYDIHPQQIVFSKYAHLKHYCEENHNYSCCDKVVFALHMVFIQKHHQGESNCTSQATVRHHHLVDLVQRNQSEPVQEPCLPHNPFHVRKTEYIR